MILIILFVVLSLSFAFTHLLTKYAHLGPDAAPLIGFFPLYVWVGITMLGVYKIVSDKISQEFNLPRWMIPFVTIVAMILLFTAGFIIALAVSFGIACAITAFKKIIS